MRKIGPSDRYATPPSIPVPPKRSEGKPPPSQTPLLLRLTRGQCSASQLRWSQTWGFWKNSLKEKCWQVPAGCYPSSSAVFLLHRSEDHPFIWERGLRSHTQYATQTGFRLAAVLLPQSPACWHTSMHCQAWLTSSLTTDLKPRVS